MPQVNEGLIYIKNNHGSSGPQAATVTGHFQQIPFHGHFSTHTVQPPLTCRGRQQYRVMTELGTGKAATLQGLKELVRLRPLQPEVRLNSDSMWSSQKTKLLELEAGC